jgi:hypothetical protein
MRALAAILACLLAACAAPPPQSSRDQPPSLAGRTAGAGQRCVVIEQSEPLRVSESDPHVLLYGNGKTIWANQLQSGCNFHHGDTLVSQPIGSSHCRGDLVRSVDPFTHIQGPSCLLGDFIPYTR